MLTLVLGVGWHLFTTEYVDDGYRPLFRQPLFRQNASEKAQLINPNTNTNSDPNPNPNLFALPI